MTSEMTAVYARTGTVSPSTNANSALPLMRVLGNHLSANVSLAFAVAIGRSMRVGGAEEPGASLDLVGLGLAPCSSFTAGRFGESFRPVAGIRVQKSMSPIPPPPGGMAGVFFSGRSATMASVVMRRPATEAPFCSAQRSTLVGSMMPFLTMST